MKKLLLGIAGFGLLASTMTSCKKDYDCVCTYPGFNGTTETDTWPYKKVKKKDAEAACDTWDALHKPDGSCKLK
jgi:hypothetical protein